jgi:ATP-dependent RNA helicase RhlE
MSFENLGLSDALVRAVADAGYTQPTPIQSQAIPVVLSGADLLAGAQTGTGKTAAFVLPILQRLMNTTPAARTAETGKRGPGHRIRVLILTPTRELAAQVEESVRTYGKHSSISSCAVFGGVSINPQIDRLRRGVDILVATPGRLLDHCGQRTLDLSAVEILVLDEADRMLDMGFIPDIKRILAILPKRRQNLLFSATFADPIRALADSLLSSPASIQVTPRNSTVEAVAQTAHPVDAARKAELLVHLVKEGNWFQVLVFTRTKHGANKLAARLEKSEVPALAIHGNKSQNARTRALADFKNGKLQVLVATDIAARGLDIENLPHVVNFELPHVPEDYIHRIGRTGRAGASGEAISLVSGEENGRLRDIERLIKRSITRVVVPGFEAGRPGVQAAAEIESDQRPSRANSTPRAPSSSHKRQATGSRGKGPRGNVARANASSDRYAPRPDGARSSGARPGGARAGTPARGEVDGNRARPDVDGNRARSDADGNRAPSHTESAARPGSARFERNGTSSRATGTGRNADRRDNARPNGETSSLVRSNLPPGWSAGSQARRGR